MSITHLDPATQRPTPISTPVSMVERMTLILGVFTGRATRLTLEEVARATMLPRSTVHRILDQLVRQGWLEHSTFGYALGPRALSLGGDREGHGEIREAAAGRLLDLHLRTGLTVHLAVLDGAEIVYLDKIGGRAAKGVPSRVGGRAAAHSTALGKAMLAWLEPEQVDELLSDDIRRFTSHTIRDLGTLHQELNRIRSRRGIAFERGESFPGITCVAAAIRGPEGPVAAISLVAPAGAQLLSVAPIIVAAAREVSADLYPERTMARAGRRLSSVPASSWSRDTLDGFMAASSDQWL